MKRATLLTVALASLLTLGITTSVQAQCPDTCQINLINGVTTGNCVNAFMNFTVAPTDLDSDGWYESVLKLNLDPANGCTQAQVELFYSAHPKGYTVNIGDSATNNGKGGDAATQENDAETEVDGQALTVFASDKGKSDQLNRVAFPRLKGRMLKLHVVDNVISWQLGQWSGFSEASAFVGPFGSEILYALNGQPDAEGPVNYDIFVGLNSVVSHQANRLGSGVHLARVTVLP